MTTHGTLQGYADGCRRNVNCPAELSCEATRIRANGDWQFSKLLAAGMTGAEAAAEVARIDAELRPKVAKPAKPRKPPKPRGTRKVAYAEHGTRNGVDSRRCRTDEECENFGKEGMVTCRQAYNAYQRELYARRRQNQAAA